MRRFEPKPKNETTSPSSNNLKTDTETHALTPQSMEGPFMQSINYNGNFDSNLSLIDGEIVLIKTKNVAIAPTPLPLNLQANFGITKPLPYLDSFLLNAEEKSYPQGFVVLLP